MATSDFARASFLGLPVELRLHVYELLADHIHHQRLEKGACPRDPVNSTSRRLDILAVCKQIFSEAMPAVYSRIEHGPVLVGVPRYAANSVERVIVSCAYVKGRWLACYSLPRKDVVVSLLWSHIRRTWPSVRVVYLLLSGLHLASETGSEDLDTLTGVAALPNLQRVVIGNADAACSREPDAMGRLMESEERKLMLVDAVGREAQSLGKHIRIDTPE